MPEDKELHETFDVIKKSINGTMETKDFELFQSMFDSKGAQEKFSIISKISNALDNSALYKLTDGLIKQDENFKRGNLPPKGSVAFLLLKEEAARHVSDISLVNNGVDVTVSHYSEILNNPSNPSLRSNIATNIYTNVINSLMPLPPSEVNKDANIYQGFTDRSDGSIGSDYGPTQEDLDRALQDEEKARIAEQNRQKEHNDRVRTTKNNAMQYVIESNIMSSDEALKKSGDSPREAKTDEQITKLIEDLRLPKTIQDPYYKNFDGQVDNFVKEKLNSRIDKLMNTSKNQEPTPKQIKEFANGIVDDLSKSDLKIVNFDPEKTIEHISATYSEIKSIAKVTTSEKLLYSIGKKFEGNSNKIVQRLGSKCLQLISEKSVKSLDTHREARATLSKAVANSFKDGVMSERFKSRLEQSQINNTIHKKGSVSR